jgi:glycosyltransferase involved in cell wall biosynthesis
MHGLQSPPSSARNTRPGSMKRLYVFSPIPYFFLHQRPQKITEQFQERGIPVTYVEPAGWREYLQRQRPGFIRAVVTFLWYHLVAIVAMLVPVFRDGIRQPRNSSLHGIPDRVILPLLVPHNRFNSPLLERINASVYRQYLRANVLRHRPAEEESIALVNNPFWGIVLDARTFSAIYYDCIDEISIYAGTASTQRFQSYENALAGMSRAAFVTSQTLDVDLAGRYPGLRRIRIPNGVDAEWFQRRAAEATLPADIRGITGPRVGYIGALYPWIDIELLGELADTLPHVSLLLVGPSDDRDRLSRLRRCRNVFWLGVKPYSDVPSYVASCDVCIIPFLTGSISRTTNPVKLYEYFALGKPVVSTPLNDLEHYAATGLVIMGNSRSEFIEGVRHALAESDTDLRERRMEVARGHSWKRHAGRMLDVIEGEERSSSSTLRGS